MSERPHDQEREEALIYLRHNNVYREIEVAVQTASYAASRRFKAYLSKDDTEQLLWEWVMNAPKKIRRWRENHDEDGFARILGAVLYDEATYAGRKAKADKLGYRLGDEFYYTKAMLKKLLPSVYNEDEWVNLPAWAQNESAGRSGKALNEGFGWVATLSDISRALSHLPQSDQDVLAMRYRDGITYADAEAPASTYHARVEAAVKRLLQELGGPKWLTPPDFREPDDPGHWPAGRKAMSNAQARALTASQADFESEW